MPSMPVGFWGDDDGSRYRAAYFDMYPGIWRMGDWARFSERGSVVITGRSDATLNRGGVRLGTADFYGVVEEFPEVVDSLVVHLEDPEGGPGELILYVVLAEERSPRPTSSSASPRRSRQPSPRGMCPTPCATCRRSRCNRTGKKLELPVKRILLSASPSGVASRDSLLDARRRSTSSSPPAEAGSDRPGRGRRHGHHRRRVGLAAPDAGPRRARARPGGRRAHARLVRGARFTRALGGEARRAPGVVRRPGRRRGWGGLRAGERSRGLRTQSRDHRTDRCRSTGVDGHREQLVGPAPDVDAAGVRPASRAAARRAPSTPPTSSLVEVVGGEATAAWAVDRAMSFYASLGKRPVHVRAELPGHVVNRLQAALWREAYSLVQQGVVTVADVDAAITQGPGLRWAVVGPFAGQHLSGGPGGIAHTLAHLGPPMVEWWGTLGQPEWGDELIGTVVEQMDAELDGAHIRAARCCARPGARTDPRRAGCRPTCPR
ncbi:MAG: 3-hydroxyacyl-CoA dehydrogenase family protein [Candidatus Nanopelagicales bacterium]